MKLYDLCIIKENVSVYRKEVYVQQVANDLKILDKEIEKN